MKHIRLFKQTEKDYHFTCIAPLATDKTVLGTKRGEVIIWHQAENKMKQLIASQPNKMMPIQKMLALSPTQLACAYADGSITIFAMPSALPAIGLVNHEGASINIMTKLNNGLLTIDSQHQLCIWDQSFGCKLTLNIKPLLQQSVSSEVMHSWFGMHSLTGFLSSYLTTPTDQITAALELPSTDIALGTSHGKILIINSQGKLIHTLKATQSNTAVVLPRINHLLLRGEQEFISCNQQGHIDAWECDSKNKSWSIDGAQNENPAIHYMVMLEHEKTLCAVTSEGLQHWNLETGKQEQFPKKWRHEKEPFIQAITTSNEVMVMFTTLHQSTIYQIKKADLVSQEHDLQKKTMR